MRMLAEVQDKIDTANTNLIQENLTTDNSSQQNTTDLQVKTSDDNVTHYHIDGSGVAGIAVAFLFFIGVIIGIQVMTAIFVNTKTIDEPLRMGRIEH